MYFDEHFGLQTLPVALQKHWVSIEHSVADDLVPHEGKHCCEAATHWQLRSFEHGV